MLHRSHRLMSGQFIETKNTIIDQAKRNSSEYARVHRQHSYKTRPPYPKHMAMFLSYHSRESAKQKKRRKGGGWGAIPLAHGRTPTAKAPTLQGSPILLCMRNNHTRSRQSKRRPVMCNRAEKSERWWVMGAEKSVRGWVMVVEVTVQGQSLLGWIESSCVSGRLLLRDALRDMSERGGLQRVWLGSAAAHTPNCVCTYHCWLHSRLLCKSPHAPLR
jgi:hypothetical protein